METAMLLALNELRQPTPTPSATQLCLVQLDITKPCQIRRQTADYFVSVEDGQLLKALRKHGAQARFDIAPSGVTVRYVPLETLIVSTAGAFSTVQIRKISDLTL